MSRWSTSTGFCTKSNAPRRMASTAFSIVPKAVITMTGQSGSLSLTCRSTAMPSAPGMRRSVSTAKYRRPPARRLMASTPVAATSASRPSDCTVSWSMVARDSLSSTMSRRFMGSQSKIRPNPRQQRLLLLHRLAPVQRVEVIPPLHHLPGDRLGQLRVLMKDGLQGVLADLQGHYVLEGHDVGGAALAGE